MMHDIEEITKRLPGLDCGSCGAPTCMAFAEDIVKGQTSADECTVILKRILREKDLHDELIGSALDDLKGGARKGEEESRDGE